MNHIDLLLELRTQVGRPRFGGILLKLSRIRLKSERHGWWCNGQAH
jgi:hypothetical protein